MTDRKSYEKQVYEKIEKGEEIAEKLNFSAIKFFWQVNPIFRTKSRNIPKFFRTLKPLANFTENDLRILSKYTHFREFSMNEIIFKQAELGLGFYFIYSGHVDIYTETESGEHDHVISLELGDYFGELALLLERNYRNATVKARDTVELIGIFRPDLERMIEEQPVVAAKLLQSISSMIANRFYSLTSEVRRLKYKIVQLEGEK